MPLVQKSGPTPTKTSATHTCVAGQPRPRRPASGLISATPEEVITTLHADKTELTRAADRVVRYFDGQTSGRVDPYLAQIPFSWNQLRYSRVRHCREFLGVDPR